jgi:LysM repeat protein
MGADLLGRDRIDSNNNDYVEELDYSPLQRSFLDRISLPAILIAVGCLVLVILLSFLFVRLQTSGLRSQVHSLADRLDELENRLLNVDALTDAGGQMISQQRRIDNLNARVNRMEASMPTIMDQIKKELDTLQKKTAASKSGPPAKATSANTQKTAKTPKQPIYHTVKKGETLYSISRLYKDRYGMTMEKINKINNLGPTSKIRVGQKIIVGP